MLRSAAWEERPRSHHWDSAGHRCSGIAIRGSSTPHPDPPPL